MWFESIDDFKKVIRKFGRVDFYQPTEICRVHSSSKESMEKYHPAQIPKNPTVADGWWRDFHLVAIIDGRMFSTSTFEKSEAEATDALFRELGGQPLQGGFGL